MPDLDPKIAALFTPRNAARLRGWCKATRSSLEMASGKSMHGHTGSVLIPVYLKRPGKRPVKALMKYSPTGAVSPADPAGHLDAHSASPAAFARDHLVELLVEPVVLSAGAAVMFLGIAHRRLTAIATLHALFEGEWKLSRALRIIVQSVLQDWNPVPGLEPIRAAKLLADHLVEDMRPRDTFRRRWVENHPGLREARWFSLPDGSTVPNPLALFDGRIARGLVIHTHVGNAHGDLHLGNAILPVGPNGPDPRRYRLIDLLTFSSAAPLARDPMFLLLSAILVHLPELGPAARRTAMAMLVDPSRSDGSYLSEEVSACIEGVWKAGLDWADATSLADEWRSESLLSLASAALRHVPWAADPVDGWWFFQLACRATGELLRTAEPAETPAPGQAVSLLDIAGPDLTAPPRWRTAPVAPSSPAVPPTVPVARPAVVVPGPAVRLDRSPGPPRHGRLTNAQITQLVDAILKLPFLRQPLAWRRVTGSLDPPVVIDADPALRTQVSALVRRLNTEERVDRWRGLLAALRHEAPHDREVAGVEQVLRLLGLTPPRAGSPR